MKVAETYTFHLFQHRPKKSTVQSVEVKKEMSEMKKILKDMQQSAAHSRFPDEMKPLLTHLRKQGLSESFITSIG